MAPPEVEGALRAAGVATDVAARLQEFTNLQERFGEALHIRSASASPARLLLESLRAGAALDGARTLIDVGSGAGIPAVPLLVALPEVRAVLLEPRERRWAFLREVIRELGLAAEVVRGTVGGHRGGPYDALTCRALAPRVWTGSVARLVRAGGVVVWWGEGDPMAGRAWENVVLRCAEPDPRLRLWRRCST